jgi:hypothetical protein
LNARSAYFAKNLTLKKPNGFYLIEQPMLLSQDDIQSADLFFDPPMTKMAANRKIHLISARGAILEGIKHSKKHGLFIPDVLLIRNKSELLTDSQVLEQLVAPLTREVLTIRIFEELQKGVPLWPNPGQRR